ncbi:MAG: hypothetical protein AAF665_15190 [Pseudomonadota bacterium]
MVQEQQRPDQLETPSPYRHLPMRTGQGSGLEGAVFADDAESENRIAVIYDHGNQPPEITIQGAAGEVQTVWADGIAIAVFACSSGPGLSEQDVVLVERYT